MKTKKAFTLIEVLLVIVVIAILAAIVIVAVNPSRQVAQANNTQRRADVNTILNAIAQYSIENGGDYPSAIDDDATNIGSAIADADICDDLVPTFVAALPIDPTDEDAEFTDCDDYDTGYTVLENADGRIVVTAPSAQLGETISETK